MISDKLLPAPHLLRCEDWSGGAVTIAPPRLTWILPWPQRGACPVSSQVQVASNLDLLARGEPDLWDSAWRTEGFSTIYSGQPLAPARLCHWRVRVRDKDGAFSAWSDPACWITDLLDRSWPAEWITAHYSVLTPEVETWIAATTGDPKTAQRLRELTPVVRFRRHFGLDAAPPVALLFACALGAQRIWINGNIVEESVLDPVQGEYDREIRYRAYRVDHLLQAGTNVIGCELAGGWHHQPVVWDGVMDYGTPAWSAWLAAADGALLLATDPAWKSAPSPTLRANLYAGEIHDARREQSAWTNANFDDSAWLESGILPAPAVPLRPQEVPPIREVTSFHPQSVQRSADGHLAVDLGENIAGVLRFRVAAPVGTVIAVESAERLDPSGLPDRRHIGYDATNVAQSDLYVCAGEGTETWQPRWCYHGFQHATVRGWVGDASPEQFDAVVLRNAIASTGHFSCSDDFLNRIHQIARRSIESNLHGVIEDCPHREKCGWLGDPVASYRAWWLNYDVASVFRKTIRDIQLATGEDGIASGIVGGKRKCGQWIDSAAATIIFPHVVYHETGDVRVLENHFPYMRRFADTAFTIIMTRLADGRPVARRGDWWDAGLGDWCDIPRQPADEGGGFPECSEPLEITSLRILEALQRLDAICGLLGYGALSKRYAGAARALRDRIEKLYYNSQAVTFGSQAADSFALALGLGESPSRLAGQLRARLETSQWHSDVGSVGHAFLTPMLAAHGHADAALQILRVEGYPGLRDMLDRGATSLWERQGRRSVGSDTPLESLNHHFHAGYDAFLYHFVAGLRPAWGSVAWNRIDLDLPLWEGLDYAEARVETPHGTASSRWKRKDGMILWHVQIPPGATADISFRRGRLPEVYESGLPITVSPGITLIHEEPSGAFARISSGEFQFSWPLR